MFILDLPNPQRLAMLHQLPDRVISALGIEIGQYDSEGDKNEQEQKGHIAYPVQLAGNCFLRYNGNIDSPVYIFGIQKMCLFPIDAFAQETVCIAASILDTIYAVQTFH